MRLKLVVLLCTAGTFATAAPTFSQEKRLDVSYRNESLITVLNDLKAKTGYKLLLYRESIPQDATVSMNRTNATLEEILDEVVVKNGLSYTIKDNVIVVHPLESDIAEVQQPQNINVTGTVRDEEGNALVGVSVSWKSNRSRGVPTDAKGGFTLAAPVGETLVFSYLGMNDYEALVTSRTTTLDITMVASMVQIDKVEVSTGLFVRDKVTYTGNIASYSGEELRDVSTRDILSSLAVLEPSFKIVDNILQGSNPNALPQVERRGAGAGSLYSVQDEFSSDPNLPLCILNGIEVPFSRIYDLDPYRVESIHILTDAGSTAIYGSKGANGVLVVETIKAKQGEYQVSYNGRFAVDGPDLSVFNMMNSAEKLEFEKKSNKYYYPLRRGDEQTGRINTELMDLYYHFQKEVARGVDTYWLSEPLRTPFSQWHSVRVSGGTEELALDVAANLGNENGAMKNNKRDTWGGTANIVFRKGKFIVTNDTDINGYQGKESNYGYFSEWVNASPYYTKYNEEGGIDKWLWQMGDMGTFSGNYNSLSAITRSVPNPLWNASLNSKDEERQISVANNFMIQFKMDKFWLNANVLIRRNQLQRTIFKDPDHTDFAYEDRYKKGTYRNAEMSGNEYQARFRAYYGDSFNGHTVSANMSAYITETKNSSVTTEAEGFPSGSKGSPNYAYSYKSDSKPGYSYQKRRSVGVMLAGNYDYKQRYLLDFTIATDGSTIFGSNEVFQPFWSAGFGWNIYREQFASNWNVDLLRITGTIGTNGN